MIDFTPLHDVCDEEDYEWMGLHAPGHLKVIERLVREGATADQIKHQMGRRVGPEREPFVKRCEGAARYLRANKAEA